MHSLLHLIAFAVCVIASAPPERHNSKRFHELPPASVTGQLGETTRPSLYVSKNRESCFHTKIIDTDMKSDKLMAIRSLRSTHYIQLTIRTMLRVSYSINPESGYIVLMSLLDPSIHQRERRENAISAQRVISSRRMVSTVNLISASQMKRLKQPQVAQ